MDTAPETEFDVAVVGAGVAGIAAAVMLARAGLSVAILEARDRIGGRVWSESVLGLACPIEYGAEFIHGHAPVTHALLRAAGSIPIDTAGRRLTRRGGRLRERADQFAHVQQLMRQAASLTSDLSVNEFLRRHAGGYPPEVAAYVRMMVEGFDAADPEQASVQAVAEEWSGSSLEGQFRPAGGYAALLSFLTYAAGETTRWLLGTQVEAIEWGGQRVRLLAHRHGQPQTLRARRAIVTLPIALLRPGAPGALRFEPLLGARSEALQGMELGAVIKVVLRFHSAFWESLQDGAFSDSGFLHVPEAPFPTLWTALPARVPLLTAWMGGPRARALAGAGRSLLIGQALQSVQQMLAMESRPIDEFVTAYVHDWSADPWARGAYGYVRVGGQRAPAVLAEPFEDTLYLAGEAIHSEAMGTVEAALESGQLAAQRVLLAIGGRG